MRKLGISLVTDVQPALCVAQRMRLTREAGFDCIFLRYKGGEPIEAWANLAAKAGLEVETLHAPFYGVNDMWLDGLAGTDYAALLCACVDACAQAGIPVMVLHPTFGTNAPPVSPMGLSRFGALCAHARQSGVRIAFENLENPGHLEALLRDIPDWHGFCWDCGHNHCYTPAIDLMALYGDRLLCVHAHDNFGQRTPGLVTSEDDLHMLPMDGTLNWNGFAGRIRSSGFQGPLTLEVRAKQRNLYREMTLEAYLWEGYARARALGFLCDTPGQTTGPCHFSSDEVP